MTPDEPRRETPEDVQHMLARARPEQLRRLLDDIRAAAPVCERDDDEMQPQRRVS